MDCLVRYGLIPEVARCRVAGAEAPQRGSAVVVQTHRGLQLGSVVSGLKTTVVPARSETPAEEPTTGAFTIVRSATADDHACQQKLQQAAGEEFDRWVERIEQWHVDVQLVDLEWTLDQTKLILYVLNERGPECTKLAIQAAAAGLGVVEVQPVSREGLVLQPTGGGCGTCGCHN